MIMPPSMPPLLGLTPMEHATLVTPPCRHHFECARLTKLGAPTWNIAALVLFFFFLSLSPLTNYQINKLIKTNDLAIKCPAHAPVTVDGFPVTFPQIVTNPGNRILGHCGGGVIGVVYDDCQLEALGWYSWRLRHLSLGLNSSSCLLAFSKF